MFDLHLPRPDTLARRQRLLAQIGERGILVLPTAREQLRNRDVAYAFRPDSDFYYLTGFAEPEALLVLIPGHADGEQILFCRSRDPERETWDGRRAGIEGAKELCQVDQCHPIQELDEILPKLLENRDVLLYPMGRESDFDARVLRWRNQARSRSRQGIGYPLELVDAAHFLDEMRLHKDAVERELMRAAAGVSAAGHRHGMRQTRPGMTEYQLQAEIEYVFQRQGAQRLAYSSIVGGGANGCILHYVENRDELRDGDLVLVDAGAEIAGYAGDITRTWPVNGRFSGPQRDIYALVLASQKAAIAAVRIGRPVSDYHDAAVEVLVDGLRELKILPESREEILEKQLYRPFYMHRTGHWLGMDVHDVGAYRQGAEQSWRPLAAGMVLTVEPGLYFAPGQEGVPEAYQGIGIRIEDDLFLDEDGPEILSSAVPKEIDEIEDLMAGGLG
ncbi:aminopeptidase P N-terminal domain-containing protein [Acidithiobacillus sp. AMEEHan]|uniref:aminopeptidase P N-terminal domain-containing protein n=1 Tax=Acidithiobacillus sp. AMEEHan TaxID=2994951 RepID=UPI0027E52AFF|nr:aminopeptidase P N-terminal domain-containing protein [Acidithiobacillus sp. AMEEHan]